LGLRARRHFDAHDFSLLLLQLVLLHLLLLQLWLLQLRLLLLLLSIGRREWAANGIGAIDWSGPTT
jgi:hypothetical protein